MALNPVCHFNGEMKYRYEKGVTYKKHGTRDNTV